MSEENGLVQETAGSAGGDWFSEAWTGGDVVSDAREAEALPEETGEVTETASAEAEEVREEPEAGERSGGPVPGGEDRRQGEILRFIREYPGVRAAEVPPEVWARVRQGESLTEAYRRYENGTLRAENERLRQEARDRELRAENRRRAAGSMAGGGSGVQVRDAFEDGWDSAY